LHDRVLRRQFLDPHVDRVAVGDDVTDQLTGQLGGPRVAFELGEVTLEDGRRGALAEVGLEDRGECQPPPCSFRSDEIGAHHAPPAP
jgi:hypothetical protein